MGDGKKNVLFLLFQTCLFQGRKSSGMFLIQREHESMRSGFRVSVVKGNKSLPLSHLSLASQSLTDTATSFSSGSAYSSNDTTLQSLGINTPTQANASSNLKSVLGTLCTPKAIVNRDGQQRLQRAQKSFPNGPESILSQSISSDSSLALGTDKSEFLFCDPIVHDNFNSLASLHSESCICMLHTINF